VDAEEGAVQLYYNTEENVIIQKVGNLDPSHWDELVRWWSDGSYVSNQANEIIVDLETFILKRGWFKDNWRAKSRTVDLSPDLRAIIDEGKKTRIRFEEALTSSANFTSKDLKLNNVKRALTDEQIQNVCASLSIPSGANFSVPGAGKTTTTLAIWSHLVESEKITKLLVICPKSAFEAWLKDEPLDTFNNAPKTQSLDGEVIRSDVGILVTNYEKLENKFNLDKLLDWLSANQVMLVIDEAHRIKAGGNSVRWRACKKLAQRAKRVELLTGTPMPQSYNDLKNLLQLSWNGLPASYLTEDRITSLRPGRIFVRTTKSELNLPEVNFEEVAVQPSNIQMQIYSALKRSYIGTLNLSHANQEMLGKRGGAVMSMIAACTNPGLLAGREIESAYLGFNWPPVEVTENTDLMDAIHNYVSYEIPPKYEWVIKFIKRSSQERKKTIVWSNLVGNLTALHKFLGEFNPAIVHGGLGMDERKVEINKFRNQENCSVLITNPQTLGEGISFHHVCNQAVYLDRTYNAGQYLQSLDRIHRLGLPKDTKTSIYLLTTENSIDNRISSRLRSKINRMADVLNDDSLRDVVDIDFFDFDEQAFEIGIDRLDLNDLLKHINDEN
jgi:SNF2 family DNA or RNA helicase